MHKETNIYHPSFSHFIKIMIFVVLGLSIIGLSAAILSMLFGKPIGDDYGAISTYNSGHWLHEAYASLTTTGRYGQSISSSLLYRIFGDKIVVLLPLIVTAWFILLAFLYTKRFLGSHIDNKRVLVYYSLGLSIVLTFLVLFINNSPQTTNLSSWVSYQLFFWPSGIITYTLPLLLLTSGFYILFFSNLHTRIGNRTRIILYTLVVFLSSLFNEVQPAIVLAVSTGLLILSFIHFYKSVRPYRSVLLVSIITTGLGLVALFFSPGRSQRTQLLDTMSPSPQGSLAGSVERNISTLVNHLYLRPSELLVMVLIGMLIAITMYYLAKNKIAYKTYAKHTLPYAILLILICVISTVLAIILVVIGYGYSAGIYSRTMLIAQSTYVIAITFLSFSLSSIFICKYGINNIFKSAVIVTSIAFLLFIPRYSDKVLTQVNSSVTYYNAWIEQDRILKKEASIDKKQTIYLDHPAVGVGDGFSLTCTGPYAKTTMWLNVQITQYYGGNDRVCLSTDKANDQTGRAEWSKQ